jgi:CDP-glucose 4,6-dehydratase
LEYDETIRFTGEWYYDFYKSQKDMYKKTLEQIEEYEAKAGSKGLIWME